MSTIKLESVKKRIEQAALTYHRPLESIHLIGVSKGQPLSSILEAYHAGLTEFAENYWQEAQDKITALQEFPITWHFIGPIQSNKTQAIALNFSWVHSVEREKIATLLSKYRPDDRPPLQILIQVNLDHETSKAGVLPEAITPLAHYIDSLPNLQLRGLMTIPGVREDEESQYRSFLRLSDLMLSLNTHRKQPPLDTLSMGMSGDFVAAIRAGSTLLRLGEAIFGKRSPREKSNK